MSAISDNLRALRKKIGYKSQEKFAADLNTTRSAYAQYEAGNVIPSDSFLQLVSLKFNVSEEWLRTGKGNMFQDNNDNVIDQLRAAYQLSPTEEKILKMYLGLKPKYREMFSEFATELLQNQEAPDNDDTPPEEVELDAQTEEDINRKLALIEADMRAKAKEKRKGLAQII